MIILMRELLIVVLTGATGNVIYNERIAGNNCVYIHVCSFEVFPARSLVGCAIKGTRADVDILFYDETQEICSICRPSLPNVNQLARGQRFHTRRT